MRCECFDRVCPVHPGKTCDHEEETLTLLVRQDMNDTTGTNFCEECARDAMESGLFGLEVVEDKRFYKSIYCLEGMDEVDAALRDLSATHPSWGLDWDSGWDPVD